MQGLLTLGHGNQPGFRPDMGLVARPNGPVRPSSRFRLPVDDHPGADRVISQAINDDKRPGRTVLAVRVIGNRLFKGKGTPSDFIERQLSGVFPVEGIDVYAIPHVGNDPRGHGGGLLEKILPAGLHGLFSHPHQHGFKVRGDEGDIVGVNEHVSATDVDLVFKRQGHGQRWHGLLHFPLKGMDGFYPACFV